MYLRHTMRISTIYSVAYKCRNLNCNFTLKNYVYSTSKCLKLPKNVDFGINRTYCQAACKTIQVENCLSVKELAKKLSVDTKIIIGLLDDYDHEIENGVKTLINVEMVELIADEFGFSVGKKIKENEKGKLLPRPPIVTIMGHVDHGKTTLLDRLRNTTVALNEAGGITQSIGAFSVNVPGLDETVTFVDTPGHAAFNSMRARGAQLTDIVVLVIAAEDGVMAQTKECLKHIRDSNVPFIVAINKIDMPNAKPEKVQEDLLGEGVQLEKYGGHTKSVQISALKGLNIDKLLILLNDLAKDLNCSASHKGLAKAIVLEAEQTKQLGTVASVLVKSGKLSVGKVMLAGNAMAKVKQIVNANGQRVKEALPSDPVQVLGWRQLPSPGEEAVEMKNEAEARNFLKLLESESKAGKSIKPKRSKKSQDESTRAINMRGRKIPYRITLRQNAAFNVSHQKDQQSKKELNVIIKADVSGSLEALLGIISRFHSSHMKLNILQASVGQATLSDLQLSESSNAIVYCFNTDPGVAILKQSEELGVTVRQFDVIYKLLDDMKDEIENILPPTASETVNGEGLVVKTFKITGGMKAMAAGCRVTVGSFEKSDLNNVWRVKRDNETIHEGQITSLKRGSADIGVVKQFGECGLILGKFEKYLEGDIIQCITRKELKTKYEWKL